MQIERIGHAIGNAGRAAGNSHPLPVRAGVGSKQLVFTVHQPDINADLSRQVLLGGYLQARAGVSRILSMAIHVDSAKTSASWGSMNFASLGAILKHSGSNSLHAGYETRPHSR